MRVLNKPYTGSYETSQVYVIDGFIVSDNVAVHSVKTKDEQFKYTDHQPVKMEVVVIEKYKRCLLLAPFVLFILQIAFSNRMSGI